MFFFFLVLSLIFLEVVVRDHHCLSVLFSHIRLHCPSSIHSLYSFIQHVWLRLCLLLFFLLFPFLHLFSLPSTFLIWLLLLFNFPPSQIHLPHPPFPLCLLSPSLPPVFLPRFPFFSLSPSFHLSPRPPFPLSRLHPSFPRLPLLHFLPSPSHRYSLSPLPPAPLLALPPSLSLVRPSLFPLPYASPSLAFPPSFPASAPPSPLLVI